MGCRAPLFAAAAGFDLNPSQLEANGVELDGGGLFVDPADRQLGASVERGVGVVELQIEGDVPNAKRSRPLIDAVGAGKNEAVGGGAIARQVRTAGAALVDTMKAHGRNMVRLAPVVSNQGVE